MKNYKNSICDTIPRVSKTVTIPRKEYIELIRHKTMDKKLLKDLIKGIEDIKAGRIERVH